MTFNPNSIVKEPISIESIELPGGFHRAVDGIAINTIPEPEYKLDDTVWLKVPVTYLDPECDEPPVFECKVIGLKFTATTRYDNEPTCVYEYEVEIIGTFDEPQTRTPEHLYTTEAEACAASIAELEALIEKRVKRTNMYSDMLTILYSKADK